MKGSGLVEFDCQRARQTIHRVLDGEVLDGGLQGWLREHLVTCAACREFRAELHAIQSSLRSLPGLKLPEEALQKVWQSTTQIDAAPTRRRSAFDWRPAAAAAVLAVALFGLWQWMRPAGSSYSEQELRQAAEQTRMVLQLTSRALRRTEQVAVRDVLGHKVSGALQRVPIDWPQANVGAEGI